MTSVLKCDGCDKLADDTKPLGWLEVRRFKEEPEEERVGGFTFSSGSDFEFVGHCCSVRCLANLALAQNGEEVSEV